MKRVFDRSERSNNVTTTDECRSQYSCFVDTRAPIEENAYG